MGEPLEPIQALKMFGGVFIDRGVVIQNVDDIQVIPNRNTSPYVICRPMYLTFMLIILCR